MEIIGILRSFRHDWKHLLLEALYGAHTGAPFFVDDSAFFVYFPSGPRSNRYSSRAESAGRVDGSRSSDRHIGNLYTVSSDLRAFQVLTRLFWYAPGIYFRCILREVGCSIWNTCVQEVGKSRAGRLLLNGTYLLGNVKVGPVLQAGCSCGYNRSIRLSNFPIRTFLSTRIGGICCANTCWKCSKINATIHKPVIDVSYYYEFKLFLNYLSDSPLDKSQLLLFSDSFG